MLTYIAILCTIGVLILIFSFFDRRSEHNKILTYLSEAKEREQEIQDLLVIAKGYWESARINRVETEHNKDDIHKVSKELVEKVETTGTRLEQKIETVPPKVAEILKDSDSQHGSMKTPNLPRSEEINRGEY